MKSLVTKTIIVILFILSLSVSCSSGDHNKGKKVERAKSQQFFQEQTPLSPKELAKMIRKSTVVIKCYYKEPKFFGLKKKSYEVMGSGFFMNRANGEYFILTNMHVIGFDRLFYSKDHSIPKFLEYKVFVIPYDRNDSIPVNRIFIDKSFKDMAILTVDEDIGEYPLLMLNSELPEIGTKVFAMGHPFASEFSFTEGVVSNIVKIPTLKDKPVVYIQTDAPINQGNSGGPLVNAFGRVVGMNTCGISKSVSEGMNFAISSSEIIKEIDNEKFVPLPSDPQKIHDFIASLYKN